MKYVTRKFKEDLAIRAGCVVSCVEIGVPSTNVQFLQFCRRMFSLVGLVAVKIDELLWIMDKGAGCSLVFLVFSMKGFQCHCCCVQIMAPEELNSLDPSIYCEFSLKRNVFETFLLSENLQYMV